MCFLSSFHELSIFGEKLAVHSNHACTSVRRIITKVTTQNIVWGGGLTTTLPGRTGPYSGLMHAHTNTDTLYTGIYLAF